METWRWLQGEILDVYFGLKIAWKLNIPRLIVESDSSLVVNLIRGHWEDTHPLHGLLSEYRSLLNGNWDCSLNHVYRECNCAADRLAYLGHGWNLGLHELETPPEDVLISLEEDKMGLARPRMIVS